MPNEPVLGGRPSGLGSLLDMCLLDMELDAAVLGPLVLFVVRRDGTVRAQALSAQTSRVDASLA